MHILIILSLLLLLVLYASALERTVRQERWRGQHSSSWGSSEEHHARRRFRFCMRHPDHPRCNGFIPPPMPPPPFDGEDFGPPPPPPPRPVIIKETVIESQPQERIPPPRFGILPDEARNFLLQSCSNGLLNCKAPASNEFVQKRQMVLQFESDTKRQAAEPNKSSSYNRPTAQDPTVENRLNLMHQLKQSMLVTAGLGSQVSPINDGTFENDLLLTEEQSNALIAALNSGGDDGNGGRRRRASLFLEQMPTQRWDVTQPIPYFFDPNIADYEKQMVRQAHQMIESATCIRFQLLSQRPAAGTSHLYYVKVPSPTFCGLSYIGKVSPLNPIYLSFACQDPVGIAAHETMHALGCQHEHLRADRDEYLQIKWDNVNPQFYDYFALADPSKFTSYGVKWDYGSIMGYSGFIAAIDSSKPTMIPLQDRATNQPIMGQRKRLGERDAELLKAMYCKNGCVDANVYCGAWALRNLCTAEAQSGWMKQNCKKSCKLC